jgi:hypothetical protein
MAASSSTVPGPHSAIPVSSRHERFVVTLFDRLWERYRQRVSYAAVYEQVVRSHGATFVNDHIAFRTFACQQPTSGIATLSRIFEALGYRAAGCYHFSDKQLGAIHFQHAHPQFPKLFVSELKTWELEAPVRETINAALASHREPFSIDDLVSLYHLEKLSDADESALMTRTVDWFERLPWNPPEKSAVETLNRASQYAAWVLVHGYNVNHFTSLINSHGVAELKDIDHTIAALAAAGVPMKKEIEGAAGSKLRQSATEAVVIDVPVRDGGRPATMPWTYAYFELAERGMVTDPQTGECHRFEGFLGPQATALFEMTRLKQ